MIVDLHTHSTKSDGVYSPHVLAKLAKKEKIILFSLTDHDTLAGINDMISACNKQDVLFIPGIEINVESVLNRKVEILGLGMNVDLLDLFKEPLEFANRERLNRVPKICKKLQEMDVDVTVEEVLSVSGNAKSMGRPHIAKAIIQKGYATSFREAFDKFLNEDASAYVPRKKIPVKKAIDLIHQAGGVAILAHPFWTELEDFNLMEDIWDRLRKQRIDGLEGGYPYRRSKEKGELIPKKKIQEASNHLLQYSKANDLVLSIGSDFHGLYHKEKLGMQVPARGLLREGFLKLLEKLNIIL